LKIKSIETFVNEFVGFTRITTQDGAQGWGQISTYHSDITAQVLHRQVAPWTLGKPLSELDDMLDLVTEREHKFPGSYICRAMTGLDTAIWDLRAKQKGVPVATLLGGSPGKIRAYASSMKRDITPQDEADRLCRLRDNHGFDAFKFRVGAEVGRNRDEWPGRTEDIIPTMRRAMGDDIALLVDANSCFTPARAIEVGHILLDNGISHYEEPCPYWEFDQTKQVTDALSLDVTGGEQDCMLASWRTMHLLRAIPNAGKYLEFSIEGSDYYPWQDNLFVTSPFEITDGHATVGDTPGWGVEIQPEWLTQSTYQISEYDGA
jgi:L-alanine-DL-glutamate epimerase-like enolase superfamily enzyme